MIRINDILDKVRANYPGVDVTPLSKAYVFSAKAHAGQVRLNGEPYLSHPLAVADLLTDMRMDPDSICAAMLHDTVEDTDATLEDMEKYFGPHVAALVDGVTKISTLDANQSRTQRQAATLRKMILAMAKDIRVLLIKLADRLHNMRTLGYHKPEKQRIIAEETRDIYAPMAHRLGIRRWQVELEDLAMYYLEPTIYQDIKQKMALNRAEQEKFIEGMKTELSRLMREHGIPCQISGRQKHIYSVYQKTVRRGVDVDHIYDLIAFRCLFEHLRDCYEAVGVLHNNFKPVPGRFRDYIGMPKANMYQSLHTTLVAPGGQRMEVQLRTSAMHEVAEKGIAAHWQYKEAGPGDSGEQRRFAWLRQIMEEQKDTENPNEFLDSVRMNLYPDEIFVFTPNGEVKELPLESTPVDFAYGIHSEVGDSCVGAKVNGRIVPLSAKLATGDQVEILTQTNHLPSKDWLKFVASARARQKIRASIRDRERDHSIALGRDLLDRELKKRKLTLAAMVREKKLDPVVEQLSFKQTDQLFASIAYGKISPKQVVNRIVPKEEEPEEKPGFITRSIRRLRKRPSEGIKVKGVDSVMVRFAKCCNPLPGDSIVGFITRGRGVTIHHESCPHLHQQDPDRLVEVEWDMPEDQFLPARIKVVTANKPGILADLTHVMKERSVNILELSVNTTTDRQGVATFQVEVHDTQQLKNLLNELRRIKGVNNVQRVGSQA